MPDGSADGILRDLQNSSRPVEGELLGKLMHDDLVLRTDDGYWRTSITITGIVTRATRCERPSWWSDFTRFQD
jgi:hypothetical protein